MVWRGRLVVALGVGIAFAVSVAVAATTQWDGVLVP